MKKEKKVTFKEKPSRKAPHTDGFGPRERARLVSAIRQVWYQCRARKLCVARCTDKAGFTFCEKCRARTPKLKVDHIEPCGPVDSDGFLQRLLCPSIKLQGLCKECHDLKTAGENEAKRLGVGKKQKKRFLDSF